MVSKESLLSTLGQKKPPKMHVCSYQEPFIMHGKGAKLALHDAYLSTLLQRHGKSDFSSEGLVYHKSQIKLLDHKGSNCIS